MTIACDNDTQPAGDCLPPDNITAQIGNIYIDVVIATQYINKTAASSSESPLGRYLTRFRQSLTEFNYMKTYSISQNQLELYNNPLDSNLFDVNPRR